MTLDITSGGTEAHFNAAREGRYVQKWSNYFEIYDRYLGRFKGKAPTIVEIGVQHGGSLLMWDGFFDGEATVVGVDIVEDCKSFESGNVKIFIGDQSDEKFLRSMIEKVGKADIIIDDGSHIPRHQIKTFEILFFDMLKEGGVYICEDCSTSYWPRYGGGLRRSGTFIEYAKRLCDQLNAWMADDRALAVNEATRWIKSISFFSSVVVFEKSPMSAPMYLTAGDNKIDLERAFKSTRLPGVVMALKRNRFVQSLVRQNPVLWGLMRQLLQQGK